MCLLIYSKDILLYVQSINFRIQIFYYINILTVEQPFYWTLGGMCCSSNSRSWFERSNVGQGRAWALKQHLLKGQLVTSSRSHANFKKTLSFYPRLFFFFFFFFFTLFFEKEWTLQDIIFHELEYQYNFSNIPWFSISHSQYSY